MPTVTEFIPSSPVFVNGDMTVDSMNSSVHYIEGKCVRYHTHLDTAHAKIYRYNNFDDLLKYLQSTVLIHLPYIDYPSNEILEMVLTGTQLNHIEENTSEQLIDLSSPCIKYIHSLLDLFDEENWKFKSLEYEAIFKNELKNLYAKLKKMLSFLTPVFRRSRPRKNQNVNYTSFQALPIDETILDYSVDDDIIEKDDKQLRMDRVESVFGISTTSDKFNQADNFFGIKYLSEAENDLWSYVQFAFKTASKLTDIERVDSYESYIETWNRWREFLNILARFFNLELKKNNDISHNLFTSNILKLYKCSEPDEMSQPQYLDSLLTIADYIFTDSKSSFNKTSIVSTDLCLSQKYIFSCNTPLNEFRYNGTRICLDSISLRSSFLRILWCHILRLPINEPVRSKFTDHVAKELLKLKPRELLAFFSDSACFEKSPITDNLFFIVSFEIMRLISRSWTITPDPSLKNNLEYTNQLKRIFMISVKNSKFSTSSFDDNIMSKEVHDDTVEKCFILAKFQILLLNNVSPFSEENWDLLSEIVFTVGNDVVSLGNIVKNQYLP